MDWLNVPGPLTWEELRGKVVLLDFWTYGCINCIHVIPDLHRLEEEFEQELVVIGVHSAKFENEGETDNIRQIIQRYELEHPVVNDRDFAVWQAWGIRAWPTVMLVDPDGMVFGYHEGEGVYGVMQPIIAGMVREFDAQGKIDRSPVRLDPETESQPETLLSFPGKVLADEAGQRLFVADTNHNRIVVADLASYEVLAVIGGPLAGNMDGGYAVARFDKPQGLALDAEGETLYVADTNNHTLRAIDLTAETVRTIAGTGRQAGYGGADGPGLGTSLSSPWDLVFVEGSLYIAMAGPHQLWRYDPVTGLVAVHAGSGAEGLLDRPHAQAQLAQPSGITSDGELLYFADSEASAIRTAGLEPTGEVWTLVGTGLFDFGDADGIGKQALLQHPLGVVVADGQLYVADTYNSKIKRITLESSEVRTLAGDGVGGYQDGTLADALFDEPGGLSYAAGRLYVADTNNHAIRLVDLEAGTVETVRFGNPELLQAGRDVVVSAAPFTGSEIVLGVQSLRAGEGTLALTLELPEGYKLNNIATSLVEWGADGPAVTLVDQEHVVPLFDAEALVSMPVLLAEGEAQVSADLTLYYCEAINESLCFVERARINLPITVEPAGENSVALMHYRVVPPDLD
ncbi:MAG: redoxin domain-containing protein [Anaerolineae bacterium]|nr:redoxin domain-containing protein [Anaerolineae bacterium]